MNEPPLRRWLRSPRAWLGLIGFALGYFLLGLAGLQIQSAQTGVSPVWPASGLAFAVAFLCGPRYLLAIFPAMLGLAGWVGLPWSVGLLAAAGSLLEAALPVYGLRRLGIEGLGGLRSTLWFVGLGAVLAPVFSASLGVAAMAFTGSLRLAAPDVWLLWWLGNSLGLLLVGGLGLSLAGRRRAFRNGDLLSYGLLVFLPALVLGWISSYWLGDFVSSLSLYLLLPLVAVMALREGHFGVLLTALLVVAAIVVSAQFLPEFYLRAIGVGPLYLNLALLWLLTFSGLLVGAAGEERERGRSFAWLARHDSLTGLSNRHAFSQRLEQVFQRVRRHGGEAVLLQVDLDDFKGINDRLGHAAGDEVLRAVARAMREVVRARDTVARVGGDEFMLLLEGCSAEDARGVARKLRERLQALRVGGQTGGISVSIGLVPVSPDHRRVEELLRRADSACYQAKDAGKDRVFEGA